MLNMYDVGESQLFDTDRLGSVMVLLVVTLLVWLNPVRADGSVQSEGRPAYVQLARGYLIHSQSSDGQLMLGRSAVTGKPLLGTDPMMQWQAMRVLADWAGVAEDDRARAVVDRALAYWLGRLEPVGGRLLIRRKAGAPCRTLDVAGLLWAVQARLAQPAGCDAVLLKQLQIARQGLVSQLLYMRRQDGHFFTLDSGQDDPTGNNTAACDALVLRVLIELAGAGQWVGAAPLRQVVLESAAAMYQGYMVQPSHEGRTLQFTEQFVPLAIGAYVRLGEMPWKEVPYYRQRIQEIVTAAVDVVSFWPKVTDRPIDRAPLALLVYAWQVRYLRHQATSAGLVMDGLGPVRGDLLIRLRAINSHQLANVHASDYVRRIDLASHRQLTGGYVEGPKVPICRLDVPAAMLEVALVSGLTADDLR